MSNHTLTRGKPSVPATGPGIKGGKKYRGGTIPADVRSLSRSYTKEATMRIAAIMRDENINPQVCLTAAGMLLDRGWGKASEVHRVNVEGEGASLMRVVNEIVHVHETREQVEFRDQQPLLELAPTDDDASQSTH